MSSGASREESAVEPTRSASLAALGLRFRGGQRRKERGRRGSWSSARLGGDRGQEPLAVAKGSELAQGRPWSASAAGPLISGLSSLSGLPTLAFSQWRRWC